MIIIRTNKAIGDNWSGRTIHANYLVGKTSEDEYRRIVIFNLRWEYAPDLSLTEYLRYLNDHH